MSLCITLRRTTGSLSMDGNLLVFGAGSTARVLGNVNGEHFYPIGRLGRLYRALQAAGVVSYRFGDRGPPVHGEAEPARWRWLGLDQTATETP